MTGDPTKVDLFIEGKLVRYKEVGMNGIIKAFYDQAVYNDIDVIESIEGGHIRSTQGTYYSMDKHVK